MTLIKGENFETKDEAFAEVGHQADALEKLHKRLERRLGEGDVPTNACDEITNEFDEDIKEIVEVLRDASGYLKRHHATPDSEDEE